ncbi:MAG: hypothetical protein DMG47_21950 [Acidobacteria bacterium]|nr:MAG: hypothetical protein DMG47_21950 [Acidobacteriota bacterium]
MQLSSRVLSLAGWRLYTLSVCLSSFFIAYISLLFSVRYNLSITLQAAQCPSSSPLLILHRWGGTQRARPKKTSRYGGHKPQDRRRRYAFSGSTGPSGDDFVTFPLFRGRIQFRLPEGRIVRIDSEDRVNRRRILAGILSVGLLGLVALFLPSRQKTAEPTSSTTQPLAQVPAAVSARAESEPPAIPTPVVVAKAAPLPPAPQSTAGLPDVDPHKAFGSKNAPVTMEVFSDYQCPACKTLFTTTNRRLMDDYVSNGRVYLIHRDFPLPMHAHSRVAARYARAAAQIGKVEVVEQALFQNQEKWEQSGDVDGTRFGRSCRAAPLIL